MTMDTPILRGLSKPVPVGFSYGTVSDHNGSVPKLESSHGFLHLATRVDLNKSPTSITLQYTVNVYACIYIWVWFEIRVWIGPRWSGRLERIGFRRVHDPDLAKARLLPQLPMIFLASSFMFELQRATCWLFNTLSASVKETQAPQE